MENKKIDKKNIKYEYENGLTQDKGREEFMEHELNKMFHSLSSLINEQDGFILASFRKNGQSISVKGMEDELEFRIYSLLKAWDVTRSPHTYNRLHNPPAEQQ